MQKLNLGQCCLVAQDGLHFPKAQMRPDYAKSDTASALSTPRCINHAPGLDRCRTYSICFLETQQQSSLVQKRFK